MNDVTERETAPATEKRLPLLQMLLVSFQHVLLMYGGAVAVPLIVGQAAGLSREEIAFLINADLLVAGIATIVQSMGIGPAGIRMPVMMGASFAAVSSMVVMAGMPGVGMTGIFGATIAAGFFGLLIAPFVCKIVRLFPPLVTGTVITSIGLSLFPVAVNWAGGGSATGQFGALPYLGVAAAVLAVILLINQFLRGFWVNVSVLIGMALGYVLAGSLGMVELSGISAAPAFQIVTPNHFGTPQFLLAPILSMCLVVVIIFVESAGMFLALGKITGQDVDPRQLRRGLLCDAGATFLAGFMNTFTHSSFAQNIWSGTDDRRAKPLRNSHRRPVPDHLEPVAEGRIHGRLDSRRGAGRCGHRHVRHGRRHRHQDSAGGRYRRSSQPVAGCRKHRPGHGPGGSAGVLRAPAALDGTHHPQWYRGRYHQRSDPESVVQRSWRAGAPCVDRCGPALTERYTPHETRAAERTPPPLQRATKPAPAGFRRLSQSRQAARPR